MKQCWEGWRLAVWRTLAKGVSQLCGWFTKAPGEQRFTRECISTLGMSCYGPTFPDFLYWLFLLDEFSCLLWKVLPVSTDLRNGLNTTWKPGEKILIQMVVTTSVSGTPWIRLPGSMEFTAPQIPWKHENVSKLTNRNIIPTLFNSINRGNWPQSSVCGCVGSVCVCVRASGVSGYVCVNPW